MLKLALPFCFAFTFISGCGDSPNIEELCAQTISDYAAHRDNPGAALPYAELFTADGSFKLGDTVTEGREALIARHQSSHEGALWEHNLSNIEVFEKSGVYFGKSEVLVRTGPADNFPAREIKASYRDIFRIEDGRCLIKSRETTITN